MTMSDVPNSAANANAETNPSQAPSFFDLHVDGVGYLNRVREVKVKKGAFWACSISAMRGDATDVDYTKFDVRVTGTEAKAIVQLLQPEVTAKKAVIVGFKLGDIYPEKFVYENGDRKGEVGMVIKGRLLKVRFAKVDGSNVELPAQTPAQATGTNG
jgi:hypothetical protein